VKVVVLFVWCTLQIAVKSNFEELIFVSKFYRSLKWLLSYCPNTTVWYLCNVWLLDSEIVLEISVKIDELIMQQNNLHFSVVFVNLLKVEIESLNLSDSRWCIFLHLLLAFFWCVWCVVCAFTFLLYVASFFFRSVADKVEEISVCYGEIQTVFVTFIRNLILFFNSNRNDRILICVCYNPTNFHSYKLLFLLLPSFYYLWWNSCEFFCEIPLFHTSRVHLKKILK